MNGFLEKRIKRITNFEITIANKLTLAFQNTKKQHYAIIELQIRNS